MDIHAIRRHLPHRYPFLLIDRVDDYELGERLRATKNVTINEPFFQGHFPDHPVMPGVLILEAMAQSAAVLASLTIEETATPDKVYLFAGADKVRFRRPVVPGDRLEIDVRLLRSRRNIFWCATEAKVDAATVCAGELSFTYKVTA